MIVSRAIYHGTLRWLPDGVPVRMKIHGGLDYELKGSLRGTSHTVNFQRLAVVNERLYGVYGWERSMLYIVGMFLLIVSQLVVYGDVKFGID